MLPQTEVFEVIMVDSTFEIERPTRMYRKGLNFIHPNGSSDSVDDDNPELREGNVDLLADAAKPQGHRGAGDPNDPSTTNQKSGKQKDELKSSSVHTFYLRSSERKLRLVAKTERQQDQFVASIEKMLAKTIWAGKNRFESFAPIRLNVAAQWLIDGVRRFSSLPAYHADRLDRSATTSGAFREPSRSPRRRSSATCSPVPAHSPAHLLPLAASMTGGSRPSCTSDGPSPTMVRL